MPQQSLKVFGKLAASEVTYTNIKGSVVSAASKTGTPALGAYSLSIVGSGADQICHLSSPGLGITKRKYIIAGGNDTELIPGVTITFGGTLNDGDQVLIVVTDQIQLVTTDEGYLKIKMWVNRTAVTANYTVTATDYVVAVTNTDAARTITLASAIVAAGKILIVKDESGGAGTNNITVATEGSETIDGASIAVINVNYGSLTLYSDGTNWFIH